MAYDNVPEADPIATKQEFGYVEDKHNPNCETCNMFIRTNGNIGKCTIVEGDINGRDGVCNLWAYRRTKPIEGKKYMIHYTKESSGYLETPGGTKCGTCKFRIDPDGCKMVEGQIDMEYGCCIAWQPDEETANEAQYDKLFKFFGKVDLSDE
jgi:hypothetical protein